MNRLFLILCLPALLFAQDIDWWDNSKAEFSISTAEQLKGVAKLVNDGTTNFSGKTILLSNDIVLTGNFIPIGKDSIFPSRIFLGNFDGNGHSISGLSVENQRAAGLFGFIFGHIRNLTINASKIKASGDGRAYAGVLAGIHGYGTSNNIENCYVTADSVVAAGSENSFSGGLAGFNMGKILNSYFIGNVLATGKAASGGGLAGAGAGLTIEHSYFTGEVSATGTSTAYASGLVSYGGDISYADDNINTLLNRSKVTILNSYSKGNISAIAPEAATASGLVSVVIGATEISRSYSIGNISAKGNTSMATSSGLAGMLLPMYGGPLTVSNSYSIGDISAISNSKELGDNRSFSGGLVGYTYGSTVNITNSYATSEEISGSGRIGGIFGRYSNGTVRSTYYNSEGASQATGDGGSPSGIEAKNMSELKMKKTFTDWDFDVIWEIEETFTTPFLNSQYLAPSSSSIGNSSSSSLTPSSSSSSSSSYSSSLTSSSSSLENLSSSSSLSSFSSSSLTPSSSSESTQVSTIAIRNAISLQVQNSTRLDIYSINGKLGKTLYFKGGVYNIPLNDLPKGMYIVKETFGREKRIFKVPVM
jgi:hypothetical protein